MAINAKKLILPLLISLSSVFFLSGCDDDDVEEACVAGKIESCDCENARGVRTCKTDSSGWGDCNCSGSSCGAEISELSSCQGCYCSEEQNTCYANEDCLDLLNCVNDCDEDESCQSECAEQYPEGVDALVSLLDCRDKSCATYTDCESNISDFSTCLECYCDDELAVCNANNDCTDLLHCLNDCEDESCRGACAEQYPDGVSDLLDVLYCRDDYCSDYMD